MASFVVKIRDQLFVVPATDRHPSPTCYAATCFATCAAHCLTQGTNASSCLLHLTHTPDQIRTMSDLAPLVAAAIRDRVVEDMAKEIEDLKKQKEEELAPWTVLVHGPEPPDGGAPTVYARANVSMRDVLSKTFGLSGHIRSDGTATIRSRLEQTENQCPFRDFLSLRVTLQCSRQGSDQDGGSSRTGGQANSNLSSGVDDPEANIGRGAAITQNGNENNGQVEIHWWWYGRDAFIQGLEFTLPVTSDRWDLHVTPDLLSEGMPLVREHGALTVASDVAGDDAPIQFQDVDLDTNGLVSLLNGEIDLLRAVVRANNTANNNNDNNDSDIEEDEESDNNQNDDDDDGDMSIEEA